MAANKWPGATASKILQAKESVFLQFCDKIQWSMHQIFTQMYLTVFIGPSHMESPTKLFIKKFFFWWSPHFSAFEPPNRNPPKQVHVISTVHHPPSVSQNNSRRYIHLLITNFLGFNPPQYESNHHKQDLLITTSKISHCLLQLQIIKSLIFHLRSASTSTEPPLAQS